MRPCRHRGPSLTASKLPDGGRRARRPPPWSRPREAPPKVDLGWGVVAGALCLCKPSSMGCGEAATGQHRPGVRGPRPPSGPALHGHPARPALGSLFKHQALCAVGTRGGSSWCAILLQRENEQENWQNQLGIKDSATKLHLETVSDIHNLKFCLSCLSLYIRINT